MFGFWLLALIMTWRSSLRMAWKWSVTAALVLFLFGPFIVERVM